MHLSHGVLSLTIVLCAVSNGPSMEPEPINAAGKKLLGILDAMQVEKHWLAGEHITDWKTGESDGKKESKKGGPATHCGLFAAAACAKLNVPMMPPTGDQSYSNLQRHWLTHEGRCQGWIPLLDGVTAQSLANRGVVVLATYQSHDPKAPSHIAIVRPSAVSAAEIAKNGARVTQVGPHNHNDTTAKIAVQHHPEAWENDAVVYFAYQPQPMAH